MIRIIAATIAFVLISSAAHGQVIYAPPEPCQSNVIISPNQMQLLSALQGSRPNVIINIPSAEALQMQNYYSGYSGGPIVIPSGPCISPEAMGYDSQTGQPLYFRKRDLLPNPPPPPPQTQPVAPQRNIVLPPAGETPPVPKGQMIIKPWRGAGSSVVSR